MRKRKMNKLKALRAKSESLEIFEGYNIDITGLTFPELTDFAELADANKPKEALNHILYVTIRKAFPKKEVDEENGMTDEEIKEEVRLMDGIKAMKIVRVVQKLSGIGVDEKKGLVNELPLENKQENRLPAE